MNEFMLRGNAACPGCPIPKELQFVLEVLGKNSVLVIPASCSTIIMGDDLHGMPSSVPVVHSPFAAPAAIASGIKAAMEKDANVVVWAGDGSTSDIGFATLSGAAERNEDIIYICYDNEAYMNTGVQRSSLTPHGAWSTTTPEGKKEYKKPLPLLMIDHNVPYVATMSVAYPFDFQSKIKKALSIKGFRYLHMISPCPPGWRFDPSLTIEMAKLVVETGIWPLMEYENGALKLSGPSVVLLNKEKRKPIEEYLKLQGRFKALSDSDIKEIKA
ncbi:MAG: 3-methyl-2-oxobutanoate dehydrogenase subunit beta, partial [Candidatus Micrarchaeaceae archaeon]